MCHGIGFRTYNGWWWCRPCRRDVVDQLSDIRWEMIAETGNDTKTLHRSYQVEDHESPRLFPCMLDLGLYKLFELQNP